MRVKFQKSQTQSSGNGVEQSLAHESKEIAPEKWTDNPGSDLQDSIGEYSTNEDIENVNKPNAARHLAQPQSSYPPPRGLLRRYEGVKNTTNLGNIVVRDHFGLPNPSSTVAFAQKQTIVFVDDMNQVTLEKTEGDDYFVAKGATVSSPGLFIARSTYTLVAFLLGGILFAFCFQFVLFLFLGLAIESGLTSQKGLNVVNFLGTLLSIPVHVSILSQVMVLANTFVIDTWKGSKFMKTVTSWDSTMVDWLILFVFCGCPILVGSIALLTGTGIWWDITSITWCFVVLTYFIVFSLSAVYYEILGCLELVRYHRSLYKTDTNESAMITFKRAMKLKMKQRLSGKKRVTYIAHGSDPHPEGLSYKDIHLKTSFKSHEGPLSRLTRQSFMSRFYKVLDKPKREYSVDEVLEFAPYVTRASWSLESIYFRNRSTRFIAIIDGTSALTKEQANSSMICLVLGKLVTIFIIISFLVWLRAKWFVVLFAVFLYVLAIYRTVNKSIGLKTVYDNVLTREDGLKRSVNQNRRSDSLFQVQETFRITEPTLPFSYFVLRLQIILFYIIPLIILCVAKNYRVGVFFIFAGIISMVRNVLSAPAVLRELGSLDGIEVNNAETDGYLSEWREKHRLGKILGEISVGKRSNFWTGVILFFVTTFCAIFVSAIAGGSDTGVADPITFAPREEFYYEGSKHLSYASCALSHNIKSPDNNITNSLADFAFLSRLAYLDDNSATDALDGWFGDKVAENLNTTVIDFRKKYQEENGLSAVSYKLFSFPEVDLQIVSVRGTSNQWDWLSDAQLWSAAKLAQIVRSVMPIGGLWSPVLPLFVEVLSVIEDKALTDVAYYRETSAFVKLLKDQGHDVQIVGHSLGGGLAMITGAQNQIPAVAVSGPNNNISRRTFQPKLTLANLDEYTFNIIPDRDPVPRVDDLAENYQRIRCRAEASDPLGCHMVQRSLCEILVTCGSQKTRPIPCFCVNEFDFDVPTSVNGKKFTDYC